MSIGMGRPFAFRNRGAMHGVVPLALVLTGGLLCVSPTGAGQTGGVNQAGPGYIHGQAGSDPMAQHSPDGLSQIDQMRMAERHRRVVADTTKLLELSSELKAEVDQSPKDQLSLDVIRKAAEIEKLAHDLKQWMKY